MKSQALYAVMIVATIAMCIPVSAHPVQGLDVLRDLQDDLSLSDAQIDNIEEIHWNARADEIEKRARLERAELEFQKIMAREDPADDEVMGAFERVGLARMELEKIKIQRRLAVKRILTDDQELELKRIMKERKPRPRARPRPR